MKLITIFTFLFLLTSEGAWGFGRKPVTPEPAPAPPPVTQPKPPAPAPSPAPTPTPPPVTQPKPPEPTPVVIRARWEASQRDGGRWSQHVFNQLPVLGPNLLSKLPSDLRSFCSNYPNLSLADKKNFWVYFISSISQLESAHRPETSFKEAFNDSKGNPVISRGLLQISIESGNGYGCGFKTAEELHDPYKNLDCGIRILNRWIGNDGVISGKSGTAWRGGARYWSVLRKDTHLANIRSWNQAQTICQVR